MARGTNSQLGRWHPTSTTVLLALILLLADPSASASRLAAQLPRRKLAEEGAKEGAGVVGEIDREMAASDRVNAAAAGNSKATVAAKVKAAAAAKAKAKATAAAKAKAAPAKAKAKAAPAKGKPTPVPAKSTPGAKGPKAIPQGVRKPSQVTGKLKGAKEWRGKASDKDLKASIGRVNLFLTVLKSKKRYNSFIKYFGQTTLNDTLPNLLPFFGITVLVPDDAAFARMTAAEWSAVHSKPEGLLQLLAFHCLSPAYTAQNLTDLPKGQTISTADYPQRGILAYKLKTDLASFNGRPDDALGATLNDNSIYFDIFGPHLFVAHGVGKVMLPRKFFDP